MLTANGGDGMFRSTNGGATFTHVSALAATTVVFHPTDSAKAVAAGSGSIAYTSDGGLTWHASTGLPGGGRTELAYARSNPNIVYASYDSNGGSVLRSINGGVSFTVVHDGTNGSLLGNQGWYDNVIWVNPVNANDVIVGGISMFESLDGGISWPNNVGGGVHADHHAIVEDPRFDGVTNQTVYFGNDGGIYKLDDLSRWSSSPPLAINTNLGVTQFYGAAGDVATGAIFGGTQDNGTELYTPSTKRSWSVMVGGDGGRAAADASASGIFYGENQYLNLFRFTTDASSITPITMGLSDAGRPNQTLFIAPFILDPNNSQVLLAGGEFLWRTTNPRAASPTWRGLKLSPTGAELVSAIAVAPGNSDAIWVGYDNGAVFKTINGTTAAPTWSRVLPPANPFVTAIAISRFDQNVVYIGRGEFLSGGNVLKTTDGGITWSDAAGTGATALPAAPVHDVKVDPINRSTVYAGSEVGVFVSHDAGGSWALPQDGPANVSVDELFWMGSTLSRRRTVAAYSPRMRRRHERRSARCLPACSSTRSRSARRLRRAP